VHTGWEKPAGLPSRAGAHAYGFGLGMEDHPELGRVTGHGGGYPGFGSYMRWHPATGAGVVALANSTYAAPVRLTATMLSDVAGQLKNGPRLALAPHSKPWPETLAAVGEVNALIQIWDDSAADALFSPNVAQDSPYAERQQALAMLRDRIGAFKPEAGLVHDTPAHCRWRLAGEHGTAEVQILLTPENPPRVQSLRIAIPPAPSSPLQAALDSVLAVLADPGGQAALIAAEDDFDAAEFLRRLRAAAAWAGSCKPAACVHGNGLTIVSSELTGEHATLTVTVTVNPASGLLREASITW
jgi:hypothetical protein